jgi:hypothetical protein
VTKFALPALALVALLATSVLIAGADQPNLLTNGGFESGDTTGWTTINGELSAVNGPRTGVYAGQLVSDGMATVAETGQFIPVQGSATYELSGWLLLMDPNLDNVALQVLWFDGASHYLASQRSPRLTLAAVEPVTYTRLTTSVMTAPVSAATAHVTITATGVDGDTFSVIMDDLSFTLVAAAPATQPPTATPAGATSAPSTPPPATPRPALPTRTATPTPRPTPTPVRPPITPGPEPAVFDSLTNGGFEQTGIEGAPYGWRKIGGTVRQDSRRPHGGSHALSLESGTTSTKWAYQTVRVQPGAYYRGWAYAGQDNSQPGEMFLRVSWYASADGSGEAISNDDSTGAVGQNSPAFQQLATEPLQAPGGARTARIRLMFRPANSAAATAFFDDAEFNQVPAPTEVPPPSTPTASPEPATPPPGSGPTPSRTPAATSSRTPTPPPTASRTPTPSPVPTPQEPDAFPGLVNGGFEEAREDGTPYGWHKSGGLFAVSPENRTSGELALELDSDTSSSKWVHQSVQVTPVGYYRATAWAMNTGPGDELLLRISWYASANGDGTAIDNVDSTGTVSGALAGFRLLDTGIIRAPPNAHSARIRLFLRPASATPTRAFFDDATFVASAPPPAVSNGSSYYSGGAEAAPVDADGTGAGASATGNNGSPAVRGADTTPGTLTNGRGPQATTAPATASGAGSDWLLYVALLIPAAGIVGLLGAPYLRRETARKPDDEA